MQSRRTHRRRPPRQRGVALLLVVIAVGAATVLGAAFLAAQSTSTALSQNIEHHAHARYIAESGLVMAIEYVRSDPDWRSERSEGDWVTAQPFEGGAYSLAGYDGEDTNGDGQYSGDGDFSSDPTEAVTLIASGTFHGAAARAVAVLWPYTDGGSGATPGIAVATEVNFGNNALMNSYDSTQGPYGGANVSDEAIIATNSTDSDMIVSGNNGQLMGSAYVGPGGDPDEGIDISSVSGETGTLAESVDLPGCAPPDLGPSEGDKEIKNNRSETISESVKWDEFDAGNGVTLYIDGQITIHVTDDFDTGNNFRIILESDATLDLFVDGDLDFGNGAELNNDSSRAGDLTIHNCGDGDIDFGNNPHIAGTIISPNAEMETGNNARFYGIFLGYKLDFGNNAEFHQDLALLGPPAPGSGGGVSDYNVIWQ